MYNAVCVLEVCTGTVYQRSVTEPGPTQVRKILSSPELVNTYPNVLFKHSPAKDNTHF